jgi:hypothetical protein
MILDEIVDRITGRWAVSLKAWTYLTFLGIFGTKSRTYALLDITQLESFLLAISVHLINAPIYYFFAQKLLKKRFTEPLSLVAVFGSFLVSRSFFHRLLKILCQWNFVDSQKLHNF